MQPIEATDIVPDVERFEAMKHKAFEAMNAMATEENNFKPTIYVRFSPHRDAFTDVDGARLFGQTNISESGDIVIYRAQHLKDAECPGLEKLKMEVHLLSNSGQQTFI